MILEEIKNIKESKKDLRKFGLTVGIVVLLIGVYLFWKQIDSYLYLGIIGGMLVVTGLITPVVLKPLNKIWMTAAILMGWVMTRVILTIIFFIGIIPIRLISKIFRKEFLELKIDKSRESYWEIREKTDKNPADYERQF